LKIPGYKLDLELAIKEINTNGYKQVVLQIPEGLKTYISLLQIFLKKKPVQMLLFLLILVLVPVMLLDLSLKIWVLILPFK